MLNNHSLPPVDPVPYQYTYIYEDNDEGDIPGSQNTDSPGSLRNFIGEQGMGVWLLTLADNAPGIPAWSRTSPSGLTRKTW